MNSIIYKSDVQEECLSESRSIESSIDSIASDIHAANNIGSGNCSVNNIDQALNNASETIRMLIAAQEEVDTANQEVASMLQSGIEVGNSTSSQLVLNNESSDIPSENKKASEGLTIEEMVKLVNESGQWADSEKYSEMVALLQAMLNKYYHQKSLMPEQLNDLIETTFEVVNIGFDEENGESYLTYYGKGKYESKSEKLEFCKSLVTGQIIQYYRDLKKEYKNLDLGMLRDFDVPEEFSHIPEYCWEDAQGYTPEETEYNRALLILSFSDNEEDLQWFMGKTDEWRQSFKDNQYKDGGYFDYELLGKYYEIQNGKLNSLYNEVYMNIYLLKGMSHLINNVTDEEGNLKTGKELCDVFNEAYQQVSLSYSKELLTRESLDRIFTTAYVSKEKQELAWFNALQEVYPNELGNLTLPSDEQSTEYQIYQNSFATTDILLVIKKEKGEQAVINFLKSYYEKCGVESNINEDIVLNNLNLLEEKNKRLEEIFTPLFETSQKLNEISLLEKNLLDYAAKQLNIPDNIKNNPNKNKDFANKLGISENEVSLFSKEQIDAYLYLRQTNAVLSSKYGEILKEIVMDANARKSAQTFVKNTIGGENNWINALTFLPRTGGNFLSSTLMGVGNFGADIVNVFAYDGKVSERELRQRYIMEYYSGDYSLYANYDSNLKQAMTQSVNFDEPNFDISLLTSSQKQEYDDYVIKCRKNNVTPKLYEMYYDLGMLSYEDYMNYVTLENTNVETKEWYSFLASKKLERNVQGTVHQVGTGFGYMVIPIGLSAAGQPQAGNALLALASAGNSMESLAQSGETSKGTIALYGLLNAAMSFGVERMGGFFSKSGKSIIPVDDLLGKVKIGGKTLPKSVINLFANSGDEVLEEIVELFGGYALDSHFNKDSLPTNAGDVFNEIGQTAFQTFLMTPLLGGYSQGIAGKVNAPQNINTPFASYDLSYSDILRFTDFNGNIKSNELLNHIQENGKEIQYANPQDVKNYFNKQMGESYVTNVTFDNGLYTIKTKNGEKFVYNALGSLLIGHSQGDLYISKDLAKQAQTDASLAKLLISEGQFDFLNTASPEVLYEVLGLAFESGYKYNDKMRKLAETDAKIAQILMKHDDIIFIVQASRDEKLARMLVENNVFTHILAISDEQLLKEILPLAYDRGYNLIFPGVFDDPEFGSIVLEHPRFFELYTLVLVMRYKYTYDYIYKDNEKSEFMKEFFMNRYSISEEHPFIQHIVENREKINDNERWLDYFESLEQDYFVNYFKYNNNDNNSIYRNATSEFYRDFGHANNEFGVNQNGLSILKRSSDGRIIMEEDVNNTHYIELKQKLMDKGYNEFDAMIIMDTVNAKGACSYAAAVEVIIDYFKNQPNMFAEVFGYNLFINIDGKTTVNYEELLLDLYEWSNRSENGGTMILDDHTINYTLLKDGKLEEFAKNQQYYSKSKTGFNVELLNKFLNSKGANIMVTKEFISNTHSVFEIATMVEKHLKKGLPVHAGIYTGTNIYIPNNGYQKIEGGHSVYITGVTNEGFLCASWGYECIIPFSDFFANKKNNVSLLDFEVQNEN